MNQLPHRSESCSVTTDAFSKPLQPELIGELLESYRPWARVAVRKQIQGNLGRRLDESDIIQNTWLDVVRSIDQFRGTTERQFFGWLKTTLENNIKSVLRANLAAKRDVRKEVDLSLSSGASASIEWLAPVDDSLTPSKHLINGENALELAKAIESLPEFQRSAIELRYIQGMKIAEISAAIEKTPDAVVALLRRGLRGLAGTIGREQIR